MSEEDTERAVLAAENRRLREAYRSAHQSRYRRTAIGLLALAGVAALGAVVFPDTRAVLVALAGTAAFAAVLTYYLTPERFVAASVADRIHAATAATYASLFAELDLADTHVYTPHDGADPAVLYVPVHRTTDLPTELDDRLVLEDDAAQGVTVRASGGELWTAFEPALGTPLEDADPGTVAETVADGVVEQFELAAHVDCDVGEGRVTYAVEDPALGPLTDVDHPVTSFLAVGTATGLDAPVTVEVEAGEDTDLVTCRWA
ncbi:MAG: hypothetical protein ABEJ27_06620 [Halodesulfurarchaeum sp.]